MPELPNPGLVPGDFFYFLDGWGEAIEEFFTFRAEAKALLQTERALERIAEVNALLEEKGVDAPGLAVAEAKIQRNMARANEILERQKARGIEVALLAKRLESDFDVRQDLLESVFDLEEARLEVRKKEIRLAIREARAIHNFEKLAESRVVRDNIKAEKERLDVREDGLMAMLDIEEEKIEIKMEIAERELDILEDEMENLFDEREREMERRFEQKERALWLQEETLEIQLRQAVLVGDMPVIGEIETRLIDLEAQEQAIDQEQEEIEIILEQREDEEREIVGIREKALEQIKDTREEIFDVKEEIAEMIEYGIIIEAPVAVSELLFKAEKKITVAEQVFDEGNYGKAFSQAMRAEVSIIPAERILEQKGEVIDIKDPGLPRIIDIREISSERVKEQIKTAEQIIERTRRIIEHKNVEGIVFPVVVKLIERAENDIDKAEALLEKGILNSAHRYAIEARGMAEKSYKIIQKKLQTGEIKITPEPTQKAMRCQTDWDCKYLICPMVIGYDTPQCGPEGFCFCGPGRDFKENIIIW